MSALTHQVALVSDSQSVSFSDVSTVAAALQKQATRDFAPLWQVNATVAAFATLEDVPVDYWPVILRDDISQPGAAGYHTDDNGQPFALVQIDDSWPLTASHETLEMLADPFGNRTIAGAPPPQAPAPISKLKRVTYLVEVCDPCESSEFSYTVNGITVSDFITSHYYDPHTKAGARYSFQGSITAPHQVLDQGYVSFSNPANNHWYQIMVDNGKVTLNDLGTLQRNGRSLREVIDARVREMRKNKHYRTKAATMARAAGAAATGYEDLGKSRADALRQVIKKL
ncbi:MAG TPA: hypothetical protein VLY24_17025 [Bryobacteraceae bacterium]|nr:hypothetical protein [Bryobacteraceae bacterium]